MSISTQHPWIADRTYRFESSGIRRMFALGAKLQDPINLSIGQPDFPVPERVKESLRQAVSDNQNGYTPTEGIPKLRQRLKDLVDLQLGPNDRSVLVTSGTSGGLVLAVQAMINPGDEVIYFDPYFVMYPAIIELAGGVSVPVNGYPDFRLDVNRLREHITDRTKMIIVNSPGNPTGVCYTEAEIQAVAELAAEKNICLVSDEIYSRFAFDGPHISPAKFNPDTIVIDGFSKSHAMTGLRVGYMHGPQELMEVMAKLQQFTFVCAPAPAQWAALTALDVDMQREIDRYRNKRDWLVNELSSYYEIAHPGGAFYAFPKLPRGSGEEFLGRAIEESLLIIPGKIFSQVDSHFRISYAVDDRTLERGIEALKKIARR